LAATIAACQSQATAPQFVKDVELRITLPESKNTYRIGERIPIRLTFRNKSDKEYSINMATYDRSGRMFYETFHLNPTAGVVDPLATYFRSGTFLSGGLTTTPELAGQPVKIDLDINEWVRFERAGEFSLSVTSSRVQEASGLLFNGFVESSTIQLTILPRDDDFDRQQFEKAMALLGEKEKVQQREGCRILRFLGSKGAAKEMVRRWTAGEPQDCEWEFLLGLAAFPDQNFVGTLLREALSDPDAAITGNLVSLLVRMEVNSTGGKVSLWDQQKTAVRELAGAVEKKRGTARDVTVATLIQYATQPLSKEAASLVPDALAHLPPSGQTQVLDFNWPIVRDANLVPVLKQMVDRAPEARDTFNMGPYYSYRQAANFALVRLNQLDPEAGRAVILSEILRKRPRFSPEALAGLKEAELPDYESRIAENLVATSNPCNGSDVASVHAGLMFRYATVRVLPQALKVLPSNCTGAFYPLVAYLFRVSPSDGVRVFSSFLASCHGCYFNGFTEVGALYPSPELQQLAIEALHHPSPAVVKDAIMMLQNNGSQTAKRALMETLCAWYTRWKEKPWPAKEQEDQEVMEDRYLGDMLMHALTSGVDWLLTPKDVKLLSSQALSDQQRAWLREFQPQLNGEVRLEISRGRFLARNGAPLKMDLVQINGTVGSCSFLTSVNRLEDKIAQYPEHTAFVKTNYPDDPDTELAWQEVKRFIQTHGMELRDAPFLKN